MLLNVQDIQRFAQAALEVIFESLDRFGSDWLL